MNVGTFPSRMYSRFLVVVWLFVFGNALRADPPAWKNAPTPPMGWNSWDIFGTTVTEQQAKAQADAMAEHLKPLGWKYFTVDIQWYEPESKAHVYKAGAPLEMDGFSRLMPAVKKFPSAAGDAGFKPLADYVHAKGLRFGIHIMRGIPRQAVHANTPIAGTSARAADIALIDHTCPWNPDMYGVDMGKPGAQQYYDSIFKLYASWGVDFVKVDDISRAYDDVQMAEIEAIRKAIDTCGRPMVLSLSPGDTPIERGQHVMNHANMWRISDDFWDRWPPLYEMFGRLEKWTKFRAEGAWPDADMLPFGIIDFTRPTNFTKDEQILCMSLWCIARSPLILGGDMTKLDEFTLQLLTNPEILSVNQASKNNRQHSRSDNLIVWTAEVPNSADRYVALFNAQSKGVSADFSKANYKSPVLSDMGSDVEISLPIGNARRLALMVDDAGDGFAYDHAVWVEPTLKGPNGSKKLSELRWTSAQAGWGQTQINHTCEGHPLVVDGEPVAGIGTHAKSVIQYDIPEGFDTFNARGVLTHHGSIRFGVLADDTKETTPDSNFVSVSLSDLGITVETLVRDLWNRKDLGVFSGEFSQEIPLHGAGLYRLSPQQ
ncbi:Alpha-galactosidase A precursor [Planctomycetes bacterium CA13]|uniref:Alpha-galactosidase n=1 Tax=Novipirellula herctigrandis TaxID=2527986 RepID=A0A5C5ZAC0_9BACT|nr:Alpha-galactosidase A precursor [Planctomycetes bacterium CA13]